MKDVKIHSATEAQGKKQNYNRTAKHAKSAKK